MECCYGAWHSYRVIAAPVCRVNRQKTCTRLQYRQQQATQPPDVQCCGALSAPGRSYAARPAKDGSDVFHASARPEILRVLEARPSGVLVLVGADGGTLVENATNCCPCHLLMEEPGFGRVRVHPNLSCEICALPDDDHVMVLCDSCERGYHTYCLVPRLPEVPEGTWLCPQCVRAGVDPATVRTQRAEFQMLRDRRKQARQAIGRIRNTGKKAKDQDRSRDAAVPAVSQGRQLNAGAPAVSQGRQLNAGAPAVSKGRSRKAAVPAISQGRQLNAGAPAVAQGRQRTAGAPVVSKGRKLEAAVPLVSPKGRSRYAVVPTVTPKDHQPALVVPVVSPSQGPNIMVGPGRPGWLSSPLDREPRQGVQMMSLKQLSSLSTTVAFELPLVFDWCSGSGALDALQVLMVGPWSPSFCEALSKWCKGWTGCLSPRAFGCRYRSQYEKVPAAEVLSLLQVLDLSMSPSIVDMCAGVGDVARVLLDADEGALSVTSNELSTRLSAAWSADFHMSALQPMAFREVKESVGMSIIVSSPKPLLLDAFLPLAVSYADHLVCCRVPVSYLDDPVIARTAWLNGLKTRGRQVRAFAPPSCTDSLWLLIFASAEVQSMIVRPGQNESLVYVE